MSQNHKGEFFVTESEACDLLYKNPEFDLSVLDFVGQTSVYFNQANAELKTGFAKLRERSEEPEQSLADFDLQRQAQWFMPEVYQNIDIEKLVLDRCQDQAETDRVIQELVEYKHRNLYPLLRYLNYMVDTLRENNIVWGVGRGSSVASFVLYLLGVHKVDSLAYNLDPAEFFR
jgi:DNA polymerase III alpha subunit